MSRSKTSPESESIVEAADRHRRLQNALVACDDVAHVDTLCHGPNVPEDQPRFESEIVLAGEVDGAGPVVLEAIAAEGLSITHVQPQGPPGQRQRVVTVR